jgi:hypothetical protein
MMIQHPETLGDIYAELIESPCRAPTVAARDVLPRLLGARWRPG